MTVRALDEVFPKVLGTPMATAALLRDARLDIDWDPFTHRYMLGRSVPARVERASESGAVEESGWRSGQARVEVSGELDAGSVARIRKALLDQTATVVVADLRELTFCDSSGLAALLHVRLILEEQRRSLVLANPPQPFLTLARIAGVKHPFLVAE
jgi:anti-sigma B factor antagonist